MERMMGFEPTTSTLARLRSTPELHPLWMDSDADRVAERFIRQYRQKATFIFLFSNCASLRSECSVMRKCALSMNFSRQTVRQILC